MRYLLSGRADHKGDIMALDDVADSERLCACAGDDPAKVEYFVNFHYSTFGQV